MTDINNVVIVGRVTKELDEKSFGYLPNGSAKLSLSVAVNKSKKNGEQWTDEVSFFDVVIFGKSAENLKSLINKGKQIIIAGSLKQDRWEKEGQKNSRVYIVADSIQLVSGGKTESNIESSGTTESKSDKPTFDPEVFKEDIPF